MSRIRRFLALGLVISLVVGIPSVSISSGSNQELFTDTSQESFEPSFLESEEDEDSVSRIMDREGAMEKYSDLDPIRINNDTEFAEQAEENNWTGSGTITDPYIIEGYHIDGEEFRSGIFIGNVTSHFTIRDCKIENTTRQRGEQFKTSGIHIYNTTNGRLEDNILSNNSIGITMIRSDNNSIVQSEVVENSEGIALISSSDNYLGHNQISENQITGISLEDRSDRNTITLNTVSYNREIGLYLNRSNDNEISELVSRGNNQTSLALYNSTGNWITASRLSNNRRGMMIESSERNVITGTSIIENKRDALRLDSSDGNIVYKSNISSNEGPGIHITASNDNVVNYTRLSRNEDYGISISDNESENNLMYHNNFIENDDQARDNSSDNEWTLGYPEGGNYWSDHGTEDDYHGPGQNISGSDGIVDSFYERDGFIDDYPLVYPSPTPHVRIESPGEGDEFSYSEIDVNWTGMKRFTDSLRYEIRLNEEEWIDIGEETEYNLTKLEVGDHALEVKVRGEEEKTHIASVEFEVDYQVTELEISPKNATLTAGESQRYDGTGYHQGERIGLIPMDWSIDEDAGGNWDENVYTSENKGTWTVNGTYEDIVDQGTLSVEPGDASQFKFEDINDQTAGEEFQITITAFDEFGNLPEYYSGTATLMDPTGTIEPTMVNFTENTWTGEVNITQAQENITIQSLDEGIFGESNTFHVEPAEMDRVDIYPEGPHTITAGETLDLSARGYDVFGNIIIEEDAEFTWDNATEGVFNKTIAGEHQITASYENVTSDEVTVIVDPAGVIEVNISPSEDQEIIAGDQLNFSARAYDEYRNLVTEDNDDFLWTAEGGFIDRGVFYDNQTGVYGVTAIYHEEREIRSDTVSVDVRPAGPERIILEPSTDQTVVAGETLNFSARVYDEHDNLITDEDEDFTWDNADETGQFHMTETGTYELTVSYDDISEDVMVEVEPGDTQRIEIDPHENQTITAGGNIDFSAEAYDEYDNLITDSVEDFNWENAGENGRFEIREAGAYLVSASYDDVRSESVLVEVDAGDVDRVVLDPAEDKVINTLQEIDFSVEAYDPYDNLISDEPSEFTWENTSDEGLFNRTEEGEYEVKATYDDIVSSTVTVEVTLLEYTIEIGPVLDVNGDIVNDASVTLVWDDKEMTVEEGAQGIYEFDIGMRKLPEDTNFNYTVEHEDLDEPISGLFYGEESGDIQIDGIGEEPEDPAGVGIVVIIILILLIIVILIGLKASFQKTQEIESEAQLERLKKEEEAFLEGSEETTFEGSEEEVFEDFEEEDVEDHEDVFQDFE